MDRFNEMRAFAQVMEQRCFSSAAETLGLSKGSVSKQVASLERRLGLALFERTTRQVTPTDEGRMYYDRARQILDETARADLIARAMKCATSEGETLRVLAAPEIVDHVVMPRIGGFLQSMSALRVDFRCDDDPAEPNETEDWDVALAVTPAELRPLASRVIGATRGMLVASRDYLDREGVPRDLSALSLHRLLRENGTPERGWRLIDEDGADVSITSARQLLFRDRRSQLAACQSGLGIALLPDYMVREDLNKGRLVPVMPGLSSRRKLISASHADTATPSRTAVLFEEFLGQALMQYG
ncbi:LysR family transcriptional regulator [Salipiger bermudensis]|uniref:LysR family transcriptional regulator n=1 Tax=Salipiger bermudensis TaxID=344736 RepID=UPI001CD5D712|nr:LysR family transcriptional regulator [Salipiger bermudensis]MCA0963771.1 LysR family transcriptional regulator [Salipiger bermudensis]